MDEDNATLEEKVRQLHALEEMESSLGWRLLTVQLLEVARQLSGQVLNAPVLADGLYAQEWLKGKVNGIAFSIDMLETTIGSLTMDIREATRKAEEQDDYEELDEDVADTGAGDGQFAP